MFHYIPSHSRLFSLLLLVLLGITLSGCKRHTGRFRLEGKIANLNQGELYVYSLDGGLQQTDTIRLEKGRFVYETDCEHPATLVLVFPNFTEQPLFVTPGGSATLKADATNMKEMEINGGDDNDAMTAYRLQVAHAAPPDAAALTEKFIADHAASPVATYLLRRHYVDTPKPDYGVALRLVKVLQQAQPHSAAVGELARHLQSMHTTQARQPLPRFSLTTLSGERINERWCNEAPRTLIMTYAEWSNEGMSMLRRVNQLLKDNKASFRLLAISLDGDAGIARRLNEQEQMRGAVACPDRLFDEPALQALALTTVPDNIVVERGKIIARSLPADRLEGYLTAE